MKNESAIKLFKPINNLYKKVKNIALSRLYLDKKQNDKEILIKFNKNRIDYAMKIYSFYICFKCKKPYYGGLNKCDDDDDDDDDDDKHIVNPSNRLCNSCIPIKNNIHNCLIHGNEYIQWKCQFCCSLASLFCYGTTHFCNSYNTCINIKWYTKYKWCNNIWL